jgi:O-antigen/teichoic acid export membrane protein
MSLLRDTFFYSIARWGQRLVGLVTAPVLIAYFAPADYGYMSLVQTAAGFFSTLGMLAAVDQGLPRFFIDCKEERDKRAYVSTSFLISGLGVTIITIILLCSFPLVPIFFKEIDLPKVFVALIALMCIAQSFRYVGINLLKWTFQSSLFTKITLIQTLLGSGFTVVGVVVFGWKAKEVLFVTALVTIAAGVWANISVKYYIKPSEFSRFKLKELLAYSWPLLGLNVFAFFTRSLDRIFLASLASLDAVGIFSVSYTIASIFATVIGGFLIAWGPYVISTYREEGAPILYAKWFSCFAWLGLTSIIGLGLWGGSIIKLIRPDGVYNEIGVFIPWIISGTLLYYLGAYFTPGPTITKKTYWKLIGFIIAGTTNAILNYSLIPKLGILGAGIATTLSSFIAGVFNQVISNKLYYVPNRWWLAFLVILVFTSAVSFLQSESFSLNINSISYVSRILLTIFMVGIATVPFYNQLKSPELIGLISKKIMRRTNGSQSLV